MPYRSAPLHRPDAHAPRRTWGAVLVLVAGAVIVLTGRRAEHASRPQHARERSVAQAIEAAHARTMASGAQVAVLHGEGERAVVVRLPGPLVRRGADVVHVPEVIPARDAVALMPDGAWAIDARGNLFDASSAWAVAACSQRPCVAQTVPGHGRVVQITVDETARLEDGSLARRRDSASVEWRVDPSAHDVVDVVDVIDRGPPIELRRDGSIGPWTFSAGSRRVPDPQELVIDDGLFCVRGRRGDVQCRSPGPCAPQEICSGPPTIVEGLPARAAQIAVGLNGLCMVDFGGLLSCTRASRYHRIPTTPPVLTPEGGLGAVTEVAFSSDVGCARLRGGEVRCWGAPLEHGGVVRRDTPVAIRGLDAVERLEVVGSRVCALQRSEVLCFGQRSDEHHDGPSGFPVPLVLGRPVTEIGAAGQHLCVVLAGGGVRCTDGDPIARTWREPEGEAPVGAHALACTDDLVFVLDDRSRAWLAAPDEAHLRFLRVPIFDGYERIAWDPLICAVRPDGLRCPGYRDTSGINWRAEESEWRLAFEQARSALTRTAPVVGARTQSLRLREGGTGCPPEVSECSLREVLDGGVRATPYSANPSDCLLGVRGRVACYWNGHVDGGVVDHIVRGEEDGAVMLVPGLDDAVEVVVTVQGLACARRATGGVVCWGRNSDGVLTAADHPDHFERYRLDDLLSRAR